MEEESESESKNATTAKRSKAEMGGSQRTESMYLDCGNLWILGGSESAVPIAMAKLLGFYRVLLSKEGIGICFVSGDRVKLLICPCGGNGSKEHKTLGKDWK